MMYAQKCLCGRKTKNNCVRVKSMAIGVFFTKFACLMCLYSVVRVYEKIVAMETYTCIQSTVHIEKEKSISQGYICV